MKIKIGVLFGGKSVEHEVSIISAIQAIRYINKDKYDVVPIYVTKNNEMYVGEDIGNIEKYKNIKELLKNSQRVVLLSNNDKLEIYKFPFKKLANNYYDYIDVAFPIVHGTNVEDGTLQGYLKTLNVPFVGCDVTSSAIGMDKYVMKTVLKDNNIPVLNCMRFDFNEYNTDAKKVVSDVEKNIEYPVIVKPINLGSSVGIKIAHNKEELFEALDELKAKIQELEINTFKALGCNGVSRIDFMIDKDTDEVYVNEINTIPGSLSFYLWKATGMNYEELLDKLITLALKREREEKDISYSFDTNILEGVNLGGLKGTKKV